MKIKSVAIIGAGSIGGTVAFGLLANNDRQQIKEILLVDMSKNITQAQVLDLIDASSCGKTIIRASTFKEAGKCDLIILTTNTPPIEKESQEKFLLRNQRFIRGVVTSMQPIQPDAFLIVAVEPVEIYVDQLARITSLRPERIMGVGHVTICHRRFRQWCNELELSGYATDPWVIGTTQAPKVIWPTFKDKSAKQSLDQLKSAWVGPAMFQSNLIIDKKGDAWFGPSASAIQLVNAISNPDDAIETVVCTYHAQLDTCAFFPVVITHQGTSIIDVVEKNSD
ncbi:hypothetical protein BC941DRAFT_516905 [Chlamydoabsidia padenii]|nr:hypothetical protein BC941DRAFT_516905 [Chlamydoabsidia padenii]